jgi:SNF2 family DNA or RNA helicase
MSVELRPWQAHELENQAPKWLIRADPRLGKTLVGVLWREQIKARITLVVAPLVVCPDWVSLFQANGVDFIFLLYKVSPRRAIDAIRAVKAHSGHSVLVVNYDKLPKLVEQLLKLGIDALILDESHYIKGPSSSRGRAARRLARACPSVRLLTGTVAPNGPGDLWGQFACIDAALWGASFTAYKKRHLIVDQFMYDRVVGVQDAKKLQSMVDSCSSSYRREDVFGPDQWQTVTRAFDLEPRARKLYATIVKDWVLEQEKDGHQLSMTHTLSRMKRLQQLTSGYLPDELGNPILIHTNKIDLVMEDLNEILLAGEKAVIFHQFRWEGEQYAERCRAEGYTVHRISGDTPSERRTEQISEFANCSAASVFIIQTAAGGIGISLASATHCLFVSQSYSFDVEQQARDRIFSPGKSRCVTKYTANRTIDQYIAATLETKGDFNDAISRSSIDSIAFGDLELPTHKGF